MPPDARMALIVAAVVAGAVVLFGSLKGLFSFGGSAGETVGNVGEGVANASSGLPDFGQGIGDTLGGTGNVLSGVGETLGGTTALNGNPGVFKPEKKMLQLQVLNKESKIKSKWGTTTALKNEITFIVTDETGSPVYGATVTGVPVLGITKAALGTLKRITNAQGVAKVAFEVANLPGTNVEDNVSWRASHPAYNDSPIVVSG